MTYQVGAIDKTTHKNLRLLKDDPSSRIDEVIDHLSTSPSDPIPGRYFRMQQYRAVGDYSTIMLLNL
jgi:hypothetical protein